MLTMTSMAEGGANKWIPDEKTRGRKGADGVAWLMDFLDWFVFVFVGFKLIDPVHESLFISFSVNNTWRWREKNEKTRMENVYSLSLSLSLSYAK